jgi:N-acetylneuraminic acid mutarotase
VVGGFTGTLTLASIVAFKPSAGVSTVAQLPAPVRYAAVAPAGGRVIIAGGSVHGSASRAIYVFDPTDGSVRHIGVLPRPLTRAAAATLNGKVYVIGGRGSTRNSSSQLIYEIDPSSGSVTIAATLPAALSEASAVSLPSRILLAGGVSPDGQGQPLIYAITPR